MRLTPQIQIFYPAEPPPAAARGDDASSRVSRRSRHPDRSITDAPPACDLGGSVPARLVIYFAGWPGNALDNYALICELVSHGITIATVIYPDATGDMNYSSEAAYLDTVQEANRLVQSRAHDAIALRAKFDPCPAAVLGFSFGGAVAAEAALLEPRFCAAVNIDGRPWGRALHEGVKCRYLFLGGDRPPPSTAELTSNDADRRYNALLDAIDIREMASNFKRHGGIHVTVAQAEHLDFMDGALRWSRRRLLRRKPADPRWVLQATHSHVGAFLRHAFGMQSSPRPAPMAGVTVEVHARPDDRSAVCESGHEATSKARQQ